MHARWLRDLIAPESVNRGMQDLSFFCRECALAEKENAKIEKMTIEDGDGERLWELSERCLEMLPAQI